MMNKKTGMEPIEILLVDDSVGDVRLAVEALKDSKVSNRVYAVNDGVEAMAFLRKQGKYADMPSPDLILLDLNMPRKDGRETLAEIKQDPALNRITKYIAQMPAGEFKGTTLYLRVKTDIGYKLIAPFFVPCLTALERYEWKRNFAMAGQAHEGLDSLRD